jgi:hypothetical protein
VEKYFVSSKVGGRVFSSFVEVFTLRESNLEAIFPCTVGLEPVFVFANFFEIVGVILQVVILLLLCVSRDSFCVVIF